MLFRSTFKQTWDRTRGLFRVEWTRPRPGGTRTFTEIYSPEGGYVIGNDANGAPTKRAVQNAQNQPIHTMSSLRLRALLREQERIAIVFAMHENPERVSDYPAQTVGGKRYPAVQYRGDNGTFLQTVRVQGIKATSHSSVTVKVGRESRTFKDGEGIVFPRNAGAKRTFTVDHVEFAGYGLDAPGAPPARFLTLRNCGFATSGDLFQHVELGGKRYSHIVDPHTGYGMTDHSLVVVIAPDAVTANSLSTTTCVVGPTRGLQLVEATPRAFARTMRRPAERVETAESKGFSSFYEK